MNRMVDNCDEMFKINELDNFKGVFSMKIWHIANIVNRVVIWFNDDIGFGIDGQGLDSTLFVRLYENDDDIDRELFCEKIRIIQ